MPRARSQPPLAWAQCLVALVCLSGCGVRKGAPEWIPSDAAVIRCTVAGPNLQLPRLIDAVPTPQPPTGLYTRGLDPIALDELGFERDRVVCASLHAPDDATLERASEAIAELRRRRDELISEAEGLGPCMCTIATRLGSRELVPECIDAPTKAECEVEAIQLQMFESLALPLREQLEATEVPRVHWRLAGRTDRKGRFTARYTDVIGRHPGGSEVLLPGAPLPPRPGYELIRGLLELDGVVAVVRQDSGRGLLVVRELGDQLILDHFAYPDFVGLERDDVAEVHALLGPLDDAQLGRYRAALAPPAQSREPQLDPRDGTLIELDRAALERVDRSLLVGAELGGVIYDGEAEVRRVPLPMIDRLTLQVPFGTEGERLRARLRLSEDGRRWLDASEGMALTDALGQLANYEQVPRFRPALPGVGFLLRGQPSEQVLFAGPTALPKLLVAIEAASPGSVSGDLDDWQVDLPAGPMPGDFASRAGSQELREWLSLEPHRMQVELVERGRVVAVELEPN